MAPDTIVRMYSITKPITAVALMTCIGRSISAQTWIRRPSSLQEFRLNFDKLLKSARDNLRWQKRETCRSRSAQRPGGRLAKVTYGLVQTLHRYPPATGHCGQGCDRALEEVPPPCRRLRSQSHRPYCGVACERIAGTQALPFAH